jgi:hypothetical protein
MSLLDPPANSHLLYSIIFVHGLTEIEKELDLRRGSIRGPS